MAEIDFDKMVQKVAEEVTKQLKDDDLVLISRWIPVSDPLKELPKDKPLLVTVETVESLSALPIEIEPLSVPATYEVIHRYVTELRYDMAMAEWSDIDAAESTIAYQYKPDPYNPDRRKKQMENIDLIISVPEELVCSGFERPFTEEEKDILIKAIGNGIPKVIKTGHWDVCAVTKNGIIENWHKCSVCDWKNALVIPRNYCPKCGAKMDEAPESKEHLDL